MYDTSLPTIVPPAMKTQVAAAAPPAPADANARARVRDTFAQYVPAEPKKVEPPVQHKRRIARVRSTQPIRVAQQQQQLHFGFVYWVSSSARLCRQVHMRNPMPNWG